MRVTLIHNPTAGEGQPSPGDLLRLLRAAGHAAAYQSVKEDGYAAALEDPGELVVVAGGDGTVRRVARRLAGRDVPVAILPLGTANNVARTLGIGGSIREIVESWPKASHRRFDLGLATGPWGELPFIEAVGVGLVPRAMRFADYGPREALEHLDLLGDTIRRDLHVLQLALGEPPARRWEVELDGQPFDGRVLLLEALNTCRVGPNLILSEHADPGDGLLDVVIVPEDERERMEAYLLRCLDGETGGAGFPVRQVHHLRIHWQSGGLHVDDRLWPDPEGEAPREAASIDVRLQAGALVFLV